MLNTLKEIISLYESILKNIDNLQSKNEDDELFYLVLVQFFIIVKEDLNSIYVLVKNKNLYTAHIILRHILEHVITLAYILKDTEKNVRQFISYSFKSNQNILNDEYFPSYDLDDRKSYLEEKTSIFKDEIRKWPYRLIRRADLAGLGKSYAIGYRYLSMFSHPDPRNSDFVFTESDEGQIFFHKPDNISQKKLIKLTLDYSLYFIEILIDKFELSSFNNRFDKVKKSVSKRCARQ